MTQTLVYIQPNPTLAYRFVVSYWGRQLTLWSIQPSQGSGFVLLQSASYSVHSKMFQVIAKGLTLRPFGFAKTQEPGSFAADCGGWDDAKASVDFYFVCYQVSVLHVSSILEATPRSIHPSRLNSGSFLLRNNAWGKAAWILYTLRKCLECFKDTVTVPGNWILEDFLARTVGSWAGTGDRTFSKILHVSFWARQIMSGLRSF